MPRLHDSNIVGLPAFIKIDPGVRKLLVGCVNTELYTTVFLQEPFPGTDTGDI
jgi:hypothetical protein